jgi:hypothetical protein
MFTQPDVNRLFAYLEGLRTPESILMLVEALKWPGFSGSLQLVDGGIPCIIMG